MQSKFYPLFSVLNAEYKFVYNLAQKEKEKFSPIFSKNMNAI